MSEIPILSDDAFLKMRWRCLSLAADLDRIDRAKVLQTDPRLVQFRQAVAVLLEGKPNRAERVQMILSDQTPPPAYGNRSK